MLSPFLLSVPATSTIRPLPLPLRRRRRRVVGESPDDRPALLPIGGGGILDVRPAFLPRHDDAIQVHGVIIRSSVLSRLNECPT